jgi:hypothetical protein
MPGQIVRQWITVLMRTMDSYAQVVLLLVPMMSMSCVLSGIGLAKKSSHTTHLQQMVYIRFGLAALASVSSVT